LVAQDSTMYGFDLKLKNGLIKLLETLEKVDGLEWIRILYGYPTFYSEDLIKFIAGSEKVADYFDIPFQHCSDTILKKMARQERKKDIKIILENINRYSQSPFIRTAFITGFPGETKKEFNELSQFIDEWNFSRVGIFQYSHEELSDAYKYKDTVSSKEKEERAHILMDIVDEKIKEINQKSVGKKIKVIVDGFREDEMIVTGRTSQMSPDIDGEIILQEVEAQEGEIVEVEVKAFSGPDLIAG
ncbi:MAG: radical SAM protein, partial [Nitrospinae bacterium]|nr:radical SAM protein [Nitrospinota bacterium]